MTPSIARTTVRMQNRPEAFAWMALSATLFAFMNFFARRSSAHADWTVVATVRAFVGVIVGIVIARVRGVPVIVPTTRSMWLRSGFGTAAMACTFFAVTSRHLPLADAVTVNNTTPIFVAVLSGWMLGEKAGRRVWVVLATALAGVVLVVRPPILFGEPTGAAAIAGRHAALLPASIALLGAMFAALAMVFLRRVSANEPAEAVATHFSAVACVAHGALALGTAHLPSLEALPSMLAAGVCAGGAQIAMTRSYALERAARVSGFGYLQVVVAASLGALVLHEPLTTSALLGITLVVGGGAFLAYASFRDARQSA